MEKKDLGKTSTGMEANVAALLCYVLGLVTGLIFYLIEKENKFVRFHAMQSMVVFGGLFVISVVAGVIPGLGLIISPIIFILQFILWIVLMVKAYQGEKFKLPVAGDIAEKNSR
jgi:uncharacterized membrane protein